MPSQSPSPLLPPELRDAIVAAVRAAVREAFRSPPAGPAPEFATVAECLATLRMSRTEFYRRVRAGDLTLLKRGRRSLVARDDLHAFAERLRGSA